MYHWEKQCPEKHIDNLKVTLFSKKYLIAVINL